MTRPWSSGGACLQLSLVPCTSSADRRVDVGGSARASTDARDRRRPGPLTETRLPQPPIIPYLRPRDPVLGLDAIVWPLRAGARASVNTQEVKPMGFFTRR